MAVLLLVSIRRPPEIPADADHRPWMGVEPCLSCHGPGKPQARPPNHPLNDQCLQCHQSVSG